MTTAISLTNPLFVSQAAPRHRLNVTAVLPSGDEELHDEVVALSELFFSLIEPQKLHRVSRLNGFVATVTYEPTPWMCVAPSVIL